MRYKFGYLMNIFYFQSQELVRSSAHRPHILAKWALALALDIVARHPGTSPWRAPRNSRRSGSDFIGLGPGRLLGLAPPWELWASGPGARCARSWASFCRYIRRRRSAHASVRGALCTRARSSVSGPGARVPVLYISGPSPLCALGVYSRLGPGGLFPGTL